MKRLLLFLALLCAMPAGATVSLTQSNSAVGASVTSQAVTLSGSVAAGDLIIVAGRWGATTGTTTCSDGAGNTYTAHPASPKSDGTNQAFYFWAKNTNSQASLVVTVSNNGGVNHQLIVAAFDYASTTGWTATPIDQSTSNSSATTVTSGTTGSITTGVTELVFSTIEVGGTSTGGFSVNSPFTEQPAGGTASGGYATSNRAVGGDDQNAAAGSYNTTFNWTTAAIYAAMIASFKPASTAPPHQLTTVGVGSLAMVVDDDNLFAFPTCNAGDPSCVIGIAFCSGPATVLPVDTCSELPLGGTVRIKLWQRTATQTLYSPIVQVSGGAASAFFLQQSFGAPLP